MKARIQYIILCTLLAQSTITLCMQPDITRMSKSSLINVIQQKLAIPNVNFTANDYNTTNALIQQLKKISPTDRVIIENFELKLANKMPARVPPAGIPVVPPVGIPVPTPVPVVIPAQPQPIHIEQLPAIINRWLPILLGAGGMTILGGIGALTQQQIVDGLNQQIAQLNQRIADLQRQLDESKLNAALQRTAKNNAERLLADAQTLLARRLAERDEARRALAVAELRVRDLNQRIQALVQQRDDLYIAAAQNQQQIANLQNQIQQLQQERDELFAVGLHLQGLNNALQAQVQQLQLQVGTLQNLLTGAQLNLALIRLQTAGAEQALADALNQIQQQTNQIAQLQQRVNQAGIDKQKLQALALELYRTIDGLKITLGVALATAQTLQREGLQNIAVALLRIQQLQDTINRMQQELQNAVNQGAATKELLGRIIAELLKQLKDVEQTSTNRLRDLEQELERERAERKQEREDLLKKLETQKLTIEQLQQAHKELNDNLQRLQQGAAKDKDVISQLNNDLKDAQSKGQISGDTANQLKKQLEDANKKLEASGNTLTNLIRELKQTKADDQKKIANLTAKINQAETDILVQKAALAGAEIALSMAKVTQVAGEEAVRGLLAQLQTQILSKEQLVSVADQLRADLDSQRKEAAARKRQVDELIRLLPARSQQKQITEAEANKLNAALQEEKAKVERIEKDLRDAQQTITNLTQDLQKKTTTADQMTRIARDLAEKATEVRKELKVAKETVSQLTQEKQTLQEQVQNLQKTVSDTETLRKQQEQEWQQKIAKLKQKRTVSKDEISSLKQLIEQNNQVIENLKQEVSNAQDRFDQQADKTDVLAKKFEEVTTEIAKLINIYKEIVPQGPLPDDATLDQLEERAKLNNETFKKLLTIANGLKNLYQKYIAAQQNPELRQDLSKSVDSVLDLIKKEQAAAKQQWGTASISGAIEYKSKGKEESEKKQQLSAKSIEEQLKELTQENTTLQQQGDKLAATLQKELANLQVNYDNWKKDKKSIYFAAILRQLGALKNIAQNLQGDRKTRYVDALDDLQHTMINEQLGTFKDVLTKYGPLVDQVNKTIKIITNAAKILNQSTDPIIREQNINTIKKTLLNWPNMRDLNELLQILKYLSLGDPITQGYLKQNRSDLQEIKTLLEKYPLDQVLQNLKVVRDYISDLRKLIDTDFGVVASNYQLTKQEEENIKRIMNEILTQENTDIGNILFTLVNLF